MMRCSPMVAGDIDRSITHRSPISVLFIQSFGRSQGLTIQLQRALKLLTAEIIVC
jgi:hypothetical protein